MPTLYKVGDPITPEEIVAVRTRLLPKASHHVRRIPAPKMLAMLCNVNALRVEHEVNRLRGLAFDNGESGFTATWGMQ